MAEVRDLDVMMPEPRIVKLGGKEIDVSFLPTGLTFAADKLTAEMAGLDREKIEAGDEDEIQKAFNLSVDLCVLFCSRKHPEMNRKWFEENTNATQIRVLATEIRAALTRAYEGVDTKN